MLEQLTVRNLGLIDAADLQLDAGLVVITGETGVGKSMLLRSLDLLRGARARVDWIRSGAEEARVAGSFRPAPDLMKSLAESLPIDADDEVLLIERRLLSSGRHKARVNGQEVPLSLLRDVGSRLLEIQGQHEQLSLLSAVRQLRLLDRFAGHADHVEEFAAEYRAARDLAATIAELENATRERNDRRLYLTHLVEELEQAELRLGERAELERELSLMEDRDRVLRIVDESLQELYDGENSIADRLASRESETTPLSELHEGLREFSEGCAAARISLEDAVRALRGVLEDLERDPHQLESLRERMDLLVTLEERYQRRGDELIAHHQDVRAELDGLVEEGARLPELEGELNNRCEELIREARKITRRRRKGAKRLAALVVKELSDLGMKRAVFETRLVPLPAESSGGTGRAIDGLSERGAEGIEFFFGPNPGETAKPLREAASGGELSRVMLSLRRVLADSDEVPTLIFDEVDAGVGGRLGTELGRKLGEIGRSHQVLCVTHLPQIASFGRLHLHVDKTVEGNRTVTDIDVLDGDRRVREIAAMIRGDGGSNTSLAEAREMIVEAGG